MLTSSAALAPRVTSFCAFFRSLPSGNPNWRRDYSTNSNTITPGPPTVNRFMRIKPLPRDTPLAVQDDVIIADSLHYKSRDLRGLRARVLMWDADNAVWAVRLGSTGEVVGARSEKLWKIKQLRRDELDEKKWAYIGLDMPEGVEVKMDSALLVDMPEGVEVKMDLESGRRLVRKTATKS